LVVGGSPVKVGHKPSLAMSSKIPSRSAREWQVPGDESEFHFGSTRPRAAVGRRLAGGSFVPIAEVNLQPTEASAAGRALHNQNLTPACSRCLPFIMDKFLLQQQVLERLAEDLLQAEQAARAAHETATHEENVAENKYDTLGLEAAYLATGQARRADAIRQAMANWRQFRPRPYDASKGIQLGALVCLVDSADKHKQQQLFLGPDGGSMKLASGAQLVQVISSEAPLGRAMLGKCEGDEVSIQVAPIRQQFEVLRVH
jgi:transcription elongation GreA/GreB family factor